MPDMKEIEEYEERHREDVSSEETETTGETGTDVSGIDDTTDGEASEIEQRDERNQLKITENTTLKQRKRLQKRVSKFSTVLEKEKKRIRNILGSKTWHIVVLVLAILFLVAAFVIVEIMQKKISDPDTRLFVQLQWLRMLLICLFVYSLTYLAVTLVARSMWQQKIEENFLSSWINSKRLYISFFTLYTLALVPQLSPRKNYYDDLSQKNSDHDSFYEVENEAENMEKRFGWQNIQNIGINVEYRMISVPLRLGIVCFITYFIYNFMVSYVSYRFYIVNMSRSIQENKKKLELISMIRDRLKIKQQKNEKNMVRKIYEKLKATMNEEFGELEIKPYMLSNLFTDDEIENIFSMFDINKNGSITSNEMYRMVQRLYSRVFQIHGTLRNARSLLLRFKAIMATVSLIIGLFLLGIFVKDPSGESRDGEGESGLYNAIFSFKSNIMYVVAAIPALAFIIGKFIGQLFNSIIYVFFVHPFENGDIIIIKDVMYIVKEIGIMYTLLEKYYQKGHIYTTNESLSGMMLENTRSALYQISLYPFRFSAEAFFEKENEFLHQLKKFLFENRNLFKKDIEIVDMKIQNNVVSLNVKVSMNTFASDIVGIEKRNRCFWTNAYKILQETKLSPL